MKQILCIIGTDTDIGKTYTCCKIMEYLNSIKQSVTALKPIASGLMESEYGLINEDVYKLIKSSNVSLDSSLGYTYLRANDVVQQINPFALKKAIAPHIAAQLDGVTLNVDLVTRAIAPTIEFLQSKCHILIEGAGGIMVPLNDTETFLDLLSRWDYEVILVVGLKLGCLNHALLTMQALQQRGVTVAGWIANQIDPNMAYVDENLSYLQEKLGAPLLANIIYDGKLAPTRHFKELFACY